MPEVKRELTYLVGVWCDGATVGLR